MKKVVKLAERMKNIWVNLFISEYKEELTPDNFQEKFENYLVETGKNWISDDDYYELIRMIAQRLNYLIKEKE